MIRSQFAAGVRAVTPILIGVFPFGVIAGLSAIDSGLSTLQEVGLSTIVFAGAAQLAAIELLSEDAAVPVIIATMLVVNSRMVMYSAALAPHFKELQPAPKVGASYLLTDQAFAVSILHYEDDRLSLADKLSYYLGAGIGLWGMWQASTLTGAVVGTELPDGLSLDFAIPLVFIALLVPALRDSPAVMAAVVAAFVAVVAAPLPYNTALWLAAIGGIAAGLIWEQVTK
jgi:predicted branched-subunit amino acid permease